ncbi:SNF2 family protein [Diplocarpon rosae]|nr:SNF2 family protein [Diplocarpon rosae]
MLSKIKNALKGGEKSHERSSAFDLEGFANTLLQRNGERQALLVFMNIAVEVIGQGIRRAPLSTFLRPGQDSTMASNYSYAGFVAAFEKKLTEFNPEISSPMIYGKLQYETAHRDFERVTDQDSFGAAINHLYHHRGMDENLNFIYQPEFEAQRQERLAEEEKRVKGPGSLAEPPRALLASDIWAKSSSLPVSGLRAPTVYKPTELNATLASEAGTQAATDIENARLEALERSDTVISSQGSPFTAFFPPEHAHDAGESHSVTRVPTNSSDRKSVVSIKNMARKIAGLPEKKEPETREETRARFKSLYQESKKVSYTRSGDDGDFSPPEVQDFQNADHTVVEGEAEEPELEDITDEDDDLSNGARIVMRLQELQNIEELGQLNDLKDANGNLSRWVDCCAMFRINPTETQMGESVRIAGLTTALYQYQAFGVYWQMITSRDFGGGFVADDMGLGKTMSFLAYVVVERQLAILWRDVNKSRLARDNRHLLQDQAGSCPTPAKTGWISCPCSSTSPTSKMAPKSGIRMACVPQALVAQWWTQWKTHVDTSDGVLGMKIVVDHPALVNDLHTSMEDRLSSCEQSQTRGRMEAVKATKDKKENDKPKDHHEGILLLTTKDNYPKSMKKYFESAGQVHDPKSPGEWKSGTRNSLIFGIAMIDESHEEYFRNKGRAKILTELPRHNHAVRPFLWGYSGTPFSQTPRGIEGVLWAIEKHSSNAHPAFAWKKLDDLCKRYDHALKSHKRDDAALNQILGDFKPFLTKFMLRRTAETQWFGHPIMRLPPHIHTNVYFEPNRLSALVDAYEMGFDGERDALLAALQAKWDHFPELRRSDIRPAQLAFNTRTREMWRSRILATFLYLYKLATGDQDALDLTVAEVEAFQKKKRETNPYRKYTKQIVENSPKCLWLHNFLSELSAARDVHGNAHKLVIMTSFPQVAYMLQLFVLRYFPEYQDLVGVIGGRMRGSEKREIIHAFTGATDDQGKPKSKKEVRILIGLTQIIGVGLQLQQACHVVLMEPDYDFVRELQAYARVHRIGQKNPLSRSYRLIDSTNDVEQSILQRQERRKEVAGRRISAEEVEEKESRAGRRLLEDGAVV